MKKLYQKINEKGSSLLEVVISMALLLLGIVGIIGLIAFSKKSLQFGIQREYLALEVENIFENISFYEELKNSEQYSLSHCEEVKNNSNEIILNRKNICERFKDNLGDRISNEIKEIKFKLNGTSAKTAKITIKNTNDNNTYIFSKVFALK